MSKSNIKHRKQYAFTLAEVLITLLIIGTVSSLVIPNLINDSQDAELKTAWKKAYSDLNQATTKLMMDNAGNLRYLCTVDGNEHNCLRNKYLEYLNYSKICNTGESYGNCWHIQDGSSKWLYGKGITTWGNEAGAILNTGNFIRFNWTSQDCSQSVGTPEVFKRCGVLVVDVNGWNKPNTLGKDIFAIHLLENSLKPYGSTGDGRDLSTTCISGNTNTSNTGWGCAAKYLYQ
jgi:prepilin-type N-terminal cleavage/methylation domain-containing protein